MNTIAANTILPTGRSPAKLQWICCAVLGVLAIGYSLLGLYALVADSKFSYPVDLRLRWIEQGMVYQGLNPQELTYPENLLPKMILGQRNVRGNYPPWSYATSMALVPPFNWSTARVYFAFVSLFAVAAIGYWAFAAGEVLGRGWGWIAAASVLAICSICICISYGQYSTVVAALLVGCLALLQRGHMLLAGVALALAAVKPQLAVLFLLVPAIYQFSLAQKFRFFAAAVAYLAIASCGIALLVQSTPWDMLHGPASESIKFYHMSNNPLIVWAAEVFGFSLGSKLLAVAMAGVCAIMLFAVRRSGSLLAGFSICAILSLFWSYSRHYDLLLLGIPLVELLTLWRARQSKLAGAAFLFLGMMLWCPISIGMWKWPIVQLLFGAACLLATATIIVLESRIQAAELNHALRSQISKDRTVSYTAAFSSEVS